MVVRVQRGAKEEGAESSASVQGNIYVDDAATHRNYTAEVVDRAVNDAFREADLDPETEEVMRKMLGADSTTSLARAYYHGVSTGAATKNRPFFEKRRMDIPYVLNEDQVTLLNEYAPDYKLRFYDGDSHDHPMAAACRLIDRQLINSRVPGHLKVSDVGAAIIPLITSGELGERVHACTPVVDAKDPQRRTLVKMRAKRIAADSTRSDSVRAAARAYLQQSESSICNRRVQDCHWSTPVITSIHVYDVPMRDWARIMYQKNASTVEGCILYPEDLMTAVCGEMPTAGARFEVDAAADEFRMGFINSPAWWYRHKLSEYIMYGVDQLLHYGGRVYSYKIVERRGDTIFFRILQSGADTPEPEHQHFRVPGIPMVKVNGFDLCQDEVTVRKAVRKVYTFPASLWVDMLGHAKDMIEKGDLSHEKLFNYYRTVAPRQSINAVVVSGGTTVAQMGDLLPLIVHVMLFASLEVATSAADTRYKVSDHMQSRQRHSETTVWKIARASFNVVCSAFTVWFYPVQQIAKWLDTSTDAAVAQYSYDWVYAPEFVEVSAKMILDCYYRDAHDVVAADIWSDQGRDMAPENLIAAVEGDPALANIVLNMLGDVLPKETCKSLAAAAVVQNEPSRLEVQAPIQPCKDASEHAVTGVISNDDLKFIDEEEELRRQSAIREAIIECDAEAAKCEAACADQYRAAFVGGRPNKRTLRERKEMYGDPDFWYLEDGIIVQSYLGADVADFRHAAVFVPGGVDGQRLHSVQEEEFKGMSMGEYVERVHYKIDADFTGYAYTNNSLLIYNSPAISEALETALSCSLDMRVTLYQGPPGCGKTTQIVNAATIEDMILVPVRKAAAETAQRLVDKDEQFRALVKNQVRTLDSYLVNYNRSKRLADFRPRRLLADEAFMAREGRWLAAAALMGVTEIFAYGDRLQIPHVPRAECPRSHISLRHQVVDESFITYRCPAQMVACWGHLYDHKVRSASAEEGVVQHVRDSSKLAIPKGCVMMGMFQADKKLLKEKYAAYGDSVQIMTVHESQGNTYDHVWLHRFDTRKRDDNFSLYDKPAYVLVAMSRNRKSFVYVAPIGIGDLVEKWIGIGRDPRRVAAAADIDSVGQSIEYM